MNPNGPDVTVGRCAAAERELRAEDAKAIGEAEEEWQRAKLTKEQTESFAARVKERTPTVEKRLLREAEENVTRAFMFDGGVEVGWRDRDKKIREDQAKLAEWRERYEQATQSQ